MTLHQAFLAGAILEAVRCLDTEKFRVWLARGLYEAQRTSILEEREARAEKVYRLEEDGVRRDAYSDVGFQIAVIDSLR